MKSALAAVLVFGFIAGCNGKPSPGAQPSMTSKASAELQGWSYAKWGMTANEVVDASAGKANLLSQEQRKNQSTGLEDALAGSPYTTGPFSFNLVFLFDKRTQRLSSVRLVLRDPKLKQDLITSLSKKYGSPVSRSDGDTIQTIKWWAPQQEIKLFSVGDSASVTYAPRLEASGL